MHKLKPLIAKSFAVLSVVILLTTQQAGAATQTTFDSITNNTPFYDPTNCATSGGGGSGGTATLGGLTPGTEVPDKQIPGSTDEAKIWNYLIAQGWTPVQAAGIMGNIYAEGGYENGTTNIEDPAGHTNDPSNLTGQTQGWGLVGFTPGASVIRSGPWTDWTIGGKSPVKVTKDNVTYISTQLDLVYYYMKYYNNEMKDYITQATDARTAAIAFMNIFEHPSSSVSHDSKRQNEAARIMRVYGQGGGADQNVVNPDSAGGSDQSNCCNTTAPISDSIPAGSLPTFIPEPYNGAFTQAGTKHKVAPGLIAALFSEENGLGSDSYNPNTKNLPSAWANFVKSHPNPNSGWPVSSKGATGPFQFLPSTWTGLGYDISKINNLATAADAAAAYVASNGATTDKPESSWKDAIYSYNHADWYVKAVLKLYDYYNSQPGATPSGGSTIVPTPAGSTSSTGGACSCTTTATNGNTIVIDPGHSGKDIHDIDPQTGLYDHDYPNPPEDGEVFSVAQKVQNKLQSDGYNVIMTKKNVSDSVSLRQRADIANQANAALALSIHDSHGTSWDDMYGSGDGGQVYVQRTDGYRQNSPGLGRGTQKVTFDNAAVAEQSKKYGDIFAEQRTKDEGHKVAVTVDSFDGRTGIASGNLPMVQLFAKVPWVYNEVGAGGPLSQDQLDKYAKGLIDGVEKSVPLSGGGQAAASGSDSSSCNGPAAGDIVQTAVNLAWPDPYNGTDQQKKDEPGRDSALTPKPSYKQAMRQYNKPGFTATNGNGDDCGVFVATVMRASGADPDYPVSYTVAQAKYVISHPDKYDVIYPATSTSQLQPGDILIVNKGTTKGADGKIHVPSVVDPVGGHTFIYLGKQQGGYNEASASYHSRSANLNTAQLSDGRGSYMIARPK